jgi:C-terminal processing protease CtpA/Prc
MSALIYYGGVTKGHHIHGRIGILYDPVHHKVVRVYVGSPAQAAGMLPGDIVKHVDAADIDGPAFVKVHLTISRDGNILTFEILRIPDKYIDVRHWIKKK